MTPVRLEPTALLSRVKPSTTEPLRSKVVVVVVVVVVVALTLAATLMFMGLMMEVNL